MEELLPLASLQALKCNLYKEAYNEIACQPALARNLDKIASWGDLGGWKSLAASFWHFGSRNVQCFLGEPILAVQTSILPSLTYFSLILLISSIVF